MREIVIKVSDKLYEYIVKGKDLNEEQNDEMALAIADGKPLPEHHGRLIDADEVIKNAEKWGKDNPNKYIADRNADIVEIIKNEPTILEADKEEDANE